MYDEVVLNSLGFPAPSENGKMNRCCTTGKIMLPLTRNSWADAFRQFDDL